MRFLQPAFGLMTILPLIAQVLCSTSYVKNPVYYRATGAFFSSTSASDSISEKFESYGINVPNSRTITTNRYRGDSLVPFIGPFRKNREIYTHKVAIAAFPDSLLNIAKIFIQDKTVSFKNLKTDMSDTVMIGLSTMLDSLSSVNKILHEFRKAGDINFHKIGEQAEGKFIKIEEVQESVAELKRFIREKEEIGQSINQLDRFEEEAIKVFNKEKKSFVNKVLKKDLSVIQLSNLKKDYSKLKDIRDVEGESAPRISNRNIKNFQLGGSFRIIRNNPIVIDLSPQMEYPVFRNLYLGVGFSIPLVADLSKPSFEISNQYGYRIYSDYHIKSIFIHFETEGRLNNVSNESTSNSINHSFFVGGGKLFRISKVTSGYIQVNYLLNHKNARFYPVPFNWQVGIKRKLLKEK